MWGQKYTRASAVSGLNQFTDLSKQRRTTHLTCPINTGSIDQECYITRLQTFASIANKAATKAQR